MPQENQQTQNIEIIGQAVNTVYQAIRAHNAVRDLIGSDAPQTLVSAAIEHDKEMTRVMRDTLALVPDDGPGRSAHPGDFPGLRNRYEGGRAHYSSLHWCIIEYATALVERKFWDAGIDSETRYKQMSDELSYWCDILPPTEDQLDDYRVREEFSKLATLWMRDYQP